MQSTKSSLVIKLSALAAAIALQGAAFAATPSASTTTDAQQAAVTASADKAGTRGHHGMHRHQRHHRAAAMWVPGYGPLGEKTVTALALTDSQQQLLKDAQASQQALGKTRHESMKTARQAKLEQLKGGKIDPHAAIKETQDARQKAFDAHQDVDQKWLAVWDALDAGQQQKIVASLNQRAEKHTQRMQKHKHHSEAPAAAKQSS